MATAGPVEVSLGLDPSAAPPFPVGYHQFHDDASLNFRLNSWLTYIGASAAPDLQAVAHRIHNYADCTREFLQLAEEKLDGGNNLAGAIYLRAAEFFMPSTEPDKRSTRQRFVELMRLVYRVEPSHLSAVPYEGGSLPAYRFSGGTKGTIVLFGGFDSYIEQFFSHIVYLSQAGYDLVAFEGPGQGGALDDYGLTMTPAWERPVGAVLDYFGLDDVTLLGISLGGGLAIRAAAFEPRVRRVIADDVLFDFLDANLQASSPLVRRLVRLLLTLKAEPLLDRFMRFGMRKGPVIGQFFDQGMRVFGACSPAGYFSACAQYTTAAISRLVTADVLLLAGSEDPYVPLRQFHQQAAALTNVASLSGRIFTRADQAQSHCQSGNVGLALDVILAWLDQISRRPPTAEGL